MSKVIVPQNNDYLTSYIENNRTKIDEALISLRFMKQIDLFLEESGLNQKELATDLKTSQAYISQLMSGTKKINTSFINRFEKQYNLEFKVFLHRNEAQYSITEGVLSSIEMKVEILSFVETKTLYSTNNNSNSTFEVTPEINKIFRLK